MLRSDWPETHLFVFVLDLEMKGKFEDEDENDDVEDWRIALRQFPASH